MALVKLSRLDKTSPCYNRKCITEHPRSEQRGTCVFTRVRAVTWVGVFCRLFSSLDDLMCGSERVRSSGFVLKLEAQRVAHRNFKRDCPVLQSHRARQL
jgi:hypothetical protein